MERRNDIRAAMQSLLSPTRRPEPAPPVESPIRQPNRGERSRPDRSLNLSEVELQTLRELQAELLEHGIAADPAEIAHAMLQALATRPGFCRGLVAASLIEGR